MQAIGSIHFEHRPLRMAMPEPVATGSGGHEHLVPEIMAIAAGRLVLTQFGLQHYNARWSRTS